MSWFRELTGFTEAGLRDVQDRINVQNGKMLFLETGDIRTCGKLEVPTLSELREQNKLIREGERKIKVSEIIGDVKEMHSNPENKFAVFQAASQFNLLEMVSPSVIPEMGVTGYANDKTQGPSCAIACGAGTIYRNYFAEVNGKIGQTRDNQINCLNEIETYFREKDIPVWRMENGYAMFEIKQLLAITKDLASLTEEQYEELKGKLRIGIQWNTEVTYKKVGHKVTQVYCSALPIGYHSYIESLYWERLASLILSATYEATLYAALENYENTGCNLVYLTLVGGGVFGNPVAWIEKAILDALRKFENYPLDVRIVSYHGSSPLAKRICGVFNE